MSERSVAISDMQERYINSIFAAKTQIESNLQTAIGIVLAKDGIDMTEGMQYRVDKGCIVVSVPDVAE